MDGEQQKRIQRIAEEADVSVASVEESVEKEVQNMKENATSEMSDSELRRHAISVVRNDMQNITGGSSFGGGETISFPILTLGFQHREADYFVTDGDALVASGIINPPESPAGYTVFIIDESHGVDLEHASDAFMPLNTVRGQASFRQVGSADNEPKIKKGGSPTYLANSTDESKFEIVDPNSVSDDDPLSQLPSDREAKRQLIHENFITDEDRVTLQTYPEHKTATRPGSGDREYEVAFGVDVKRMRGEVVDSIKFESGDGSMTLTDETIFNEEDVPDDLVLDNMRTPGLQVNTAGELIFGENSVLDVYGFIEQLQDGKYRMQGLGVIPVVEFDYDGPTVGGDSDATDDTADESTI